VVSQLEGLGFDPVLTLEHVGVQELVAENVVSLDVSYNKLSSSLTSISEWMWTRSISVSVKKLENNFLTFTMSAFSGLDTDENRFVIISDVDESLRCLIPEEEAVFGSFVSLDPEPARLELKFGIFIEDSGITQVRSSSLSLLCKMESLTSYQKRISSFCFLVNFKQCCIFATPTSSTTRGNSSLSLDGSG
jgi:hypothetical protein